jgi:hypothetical protein
MSKLKKRVPGKKTIRDKETIKKTLLVRNSGLPIQNR